MGQGFADVVLGCIERSTERMIGEIDSIAKRELVAREKRRHVALQRTFCQRSRTERSCRGFDALAARRVNAHAGAGSAPISVRTSINSGKNECSSARLRNATPDEPPVPVLWPMMRSTVFM